MVCCHLSLLRAPHALSWDQALFFLLTRSLLLNLLPLSYCYSCVLFVAEGPPVFWDQALSFLLLGFYPDAPCCCLFVGAHLDASRITAPLPWKDSRQPVVSAVAVHAFCLLGSDLLLLQVQGLLNQNAMLTWLNVRYHNCCARKGVRYLKYNCNYIYIYMCVCTPL